jgi:hypothetical protein
MQVAVAVAATLLLEILVPAEQVAVEQAAQHS